MGKTWYLDKNDKWQYDEYEPSADTSSFTPSPHPRPEKRFVGADGAPYERAEPSLFVPYDEVDSREIIDDGAA